MAIQPVLAIAQWLERWLSMPEKSTRKCLLVVIQYHERDGQQDNHQTTA